MQASTAGRQARSPRLAMLNPKPARKSPWVPVAAGPRPASGPQIPALTEASPQFAETTFGPPTPPPPPPPSPVLAVPAPLGWVLALQVEPRAQLGGPPGWGAGGWLLRGGGGWGGRAGGGA